MGGKQDKSKSPAPLPLTSSPPWSALGLLPGLGPLPGADGPHLRGHQARHRPLLRPHLLLPAGEAGLPHLPQHRGLPSGHVPGPPLLLLCPSPAGDGRPVGGAGAPLRLHHLRPHHLPLLHHLPPHPSPLHFPSHFYPDKLYQYWHHYYPRLPPYQRLEPSQPPKFKRQESSSHQPIFSRDRSHSSSP